MYVLTHTYTRLIFFVQYYFVFARFDSVFHEKDIVLAFFKKCHFRYRIGITQYGGLGDEVWNSGDGSGR